MASEAADFLCSAYSLGFSQLFPPGAVLPVRATDRSPPDPDVRPQLAGGDALLVQLLDRSGRHSRTSYAARHLHVDARDHVHGTQVGHSARGLRQGRDICRAAN